MEICYLDSEIIVCIKPPRVLSTDEPGGMPELLRAQLGDADADVRTVHRLDRVVGGLMVFARGRSAASELSRQLREGEFEKEYLAVVHGRTDDSGDMRDLLGRDKARRMTYVAPAPAKGVLPAALRYETLARIDAMSLVRIELLTGRTHQIRCQFASRSLPLVGERKYSTLCDPCELALWSRRLSFRHPADGRALVFRASPPDVAPWSIFGRNVLTNG